MYAYILMLGLKSNLHPILVAENPSVKVVIEMIIDIEEKVNLLIRSLFFRSDSITEEIFLPVDLYFFRYFTHK